MHHDVEVGVVLLETDYRQFLGSEFLETPVDLPLFSSPVCQLKYLVGSCPLLSADSLYRLRSLKNQ